MLCQDDILGVTQLKFNFPSMHIAFVLQNVWHCQHQHTVSLPSNSGGFAFGYGLSRLAGLPEKAARTNSIEV